MHQEPLKDREDGIRHVNLNRTVLARFDLADPRVLRLERVLLELVKHDNKLVLEKGVSDTLTLGLPLVV